MIYVWALLVGVFVLLMLFVLGLKFYQLHQRRKAMEMRGYRVPGDPNVDAFSADEP
jgi:hypothetical protein